MVSLAQFPALGVALIAILARLLSLLRGILASTNATGNSEAALHVVRPHAHVAEIFPATRVPGKNRETASTKIKRKQATDKRNAIDLIFDAT